MIALTPEAPYAIQIAADPRLAPTDYGDDGIWELTALNLAAGELPGLQTSFGKRVARAIFVWLLDDLQPRALVVEQLSSSYVSLAAPLNHELQATIEYAALSSHEVIASLTLTNTGSTSWSGVVQSVVAVEQHEGVPLEPVADNEQRALFVASPDLVLEACWSRDGLATPQRRGGADWQIALAPGETTVLSLTLHYRRTSFIEQQTTEHLARIQDNQQLATSNASVSKLDQQPWDNQLVHLHHLNRGVPQIHTGKADWDAAIACAYAMSLRCYVGPTQHLPHPSFVFARSSERGWSAKGDGSDHSWLWNGQVATEAYVSCPIVAACDPALAAGIIRNYLALQQPNGAIEWKPGLAGQREGLECIPLLAAITRIIYEYGGDDAFVVEAWSGLLRHLRHWFTPQHDRDGDGLPEWTSTIQSAFDDNPSFVPWQSWSLGFDMQQAEAPDLGAYLFRECHDLLFLADALQLDVAEDDRRWLKQTADRLHILVEELWRPARNIYGYRDRDSHAPLGVREDQTLLLPLWAAIPDAERARALVATITDPRRFWRPFGMPNCAADEPVYRSDNKGGSGGTWMMWNTMLGEGLCRYGYYAAAWELFARIMAAITGCLRREKCFREAYDNDSGAGIGARDYLWGTVPLHLLTLLTGVQIVAPNKVRLWQTDLGGRTITIQRVGVTVVRHGDSADITWPDGRRAQYSVTIEPILACPSETP